MLGVFFYGVNKERSSHGLKSVYLVKTLYLMKIKNKCISEWGNDSLNIWIKKIALEAIFYFNSIFN